MKRKFSIIDATALLDRRLMPEDIAVLCLVGSEIGVCRLTAPEIASRLGLKSLRARTSLERLTNVGYLERVAPGAGRRGACYRVRHGLKVDARFLRGNVA